jgi:uncharacterized protein YbjT (DUF2867 family)
MPVVVTGASGLIGREAVQAFASTSPQVRAYVRRSEAAETLRALGAKAAVGSIEDGGTLETVMAGAHTVCHLVGGLIPRLPEDYEHAVVGSLRSVIEAAGRAGVKRLLYVSYPGASPEAANPYVRAKGQAEELIRGSGLEHVIVRTTLVYGPAGPWLSLATRLARRHPAQVLGSGRQLLAPVYVGDVAAVLARADDRDRVESGTWGLEGPGRVTADDLADLLAGRRGRKVHLSPRAASWTSRWSGPTVPRAALEVMAGDSLADAPDAAAEFGVRPLSLREGLARSAERGHE